MTTKEVALDSQILRGVVGSTAHGLAIEGQDDRDEMGVFIEPPEYVCGLSSLDHYVYRDKPDGVRSEPGDLDLTLYSLRKFCRLAAKGNPSVLLLLYLPHYYLEKDLGWQLRATHQMFYSRQAGRSFLGYLQAQKRALKGERTKAVTRPELVEKYGYDTKYAAHAIRLGYQGIEYMRNCWLTLPMKEQERKILLEVRMGELSLQDVLHEIESAESTLKELTDSCAAKQPNYERINKFLVFAHHEHWKCG